MQHLDVECKEVCDVCTCAQANTIVVAEKEPNSEAKAPAMIRLIHFTP